MRTQSDYYVNHRSSRHKVGPSGFGGDERLVPRLMRTRFLHQHVRCGLRLVFEIPPYFFTRLNLYYLENSTILDELAEHPSNAY
jgi:hypothetical protein